MTRISWGDPGTRYYETGLDRGVLYVDGKPGVAWSGLTAVDEDPSVGDPRSYYLDGVQYLNLEGKEEFEATLSAFFSPAEFDGCDGTVSLGRTPGLFATQQSRTAFGLTYRSMIGNDLDGPDHAYKIHLVYNALASPASRPHSTINADAEASPLSWKITTKPRPIPGAKPGAHLFIDSRTTKPEILTQIEDILYGTNDTSPRLITPEELIIMYSDGLIITLMDDGLYSAEGSAVSFVSPGVFVIDHESVVESEGSFSVL